MFWSFSHTPPLLLDPPRFCSLSNLWPLKKFHQMQLVLLTYYWMCALLQECDQLPRGYMLIENWIPLSFDYFLVVPLLELELPYQLPYPWWNMFWLELPLPSSLSPPSHSVYLCVCKHEHEYAQVDISSTSSVVTFGNIFIYIYSSPLYPAFIPLPSLTPLVQLFSQLLKVTCF